MRLPEITALQFAVLSLLFAGEKTGRDLRRQLQNCGGPRTSAAFSQLMTRLQDAAYVQARRCTPTAHHQQTPRESRYRLTDLGLIVWQATRRFYNSFDPPPPDLEVVPTDEAQFADRHPTDRRQVLEAVADRGALTGRGFQQAADLDCPGLRVDLVQRPDDPPAMDRWAPRMAIPAR